MSFNVLNPKIGDVVKIRSDLWFVWNGDTWRELTVDEQLEISK